MQATGRNAPCPCGSGKKYKQCCIPNSLGFHRSTVAREHFNRAVSLHGKGHFAEAIKLYEAALAADLTLAQAHANLGSAFSSLARFEDAIQSYSNAIALAPESAILWSNLGLAQQQIARYQEAENSLRTAISLAPNLGIAHHNFARLLQLQDRIDEAIVSYSTALSYQADDVQAHHNLGMLMEQTGHIEEARLHYQAALTISPTFIPAHRALADIAMRTVPLWHVPMMNDVGRNEAYQAALSRAVTPGSVVFEIGTGSGLLAMMAAKLGAETVVTCEADATIAETAIEVIKRNGYTSKIHVVPVHSSDIHIGDQLPRSPDVFVSEVFSSELLGEHVLGAIEDAKRRILAPTTKIIPQAASIMIALVGGDSLCDNLFVGDVCDFDLRPFNSIIPKRQPLAREDLTPQLLSDPVEAFSFDFRRQTAWAGQTKSIEISATRDGKCVGILQWIRVYLDDKSTFENAPDNRAAAASWTRSVYLFSEPTMLQRGDVATVLGTHNRNCPWFVLEKLKQPSRQIAANAT